MSTPIIPPAEPPNPNEPLNPNPPAPLSIKDAVAARLAGSGDTIKEKVLVILTEEEIEKRTQLVLKAISQIDQARKEMFQAAKPDQVTYDADSKIVSQGFSKNALDSKNKAKARLDKLEAALAKALDQSQFDELAKLVGGGGGGGGDQKRPDKGSKEDSGE